ncbi:MAG: hydroxymethylbilane synthase [Rhodobacterales bacterium CG15_BIG_FIL_POST_REV_8_21_14_020_59_13]|nr:MAG: hydroxymethylbilane synthase [Rhodobacterales bacterium CG15_BIG_FIL_POST_REV_8_21_14_020_59_13]
MPLRLPLPLATRKSPLALAQARLVQNALLAALDSTPDDFPIHGLVSTGDKLTDRRLIDAGGKGLFTREIDEALLSRTAAIAVHSMKDVPTDLPDGLVLAAILEREDPRDVLLTAEGSIQLSDLPQGARLGTASLRRQAQALAVRPDLEIVTLRGNVETRLGKVRAGEVDATFLARAGLKRLGRAEAEFSPCGLDTMLPAAGQAAIGLVIRADDADAACAVSPLNHMPSALALQAERAFLKALDGSCRTPLAAYAVIESGRLAIHGEALLPDGSERWQDRREGPLADAGELGRELGEAVRRAGGDRLAHVIAAS